MAGLFEQAGRAHRPLPVSAHHHQRSRDTSPVRSQLHMRRTWQLSGGELRYLADVEDAFRFDLVGAEKTGVAGRVTQTGCRTTCTESVLRRTIG
jgi:hypothetical protein